MVEIYGHKWLSSYGKNDEPNHTWAKALYDITDAELQRGYLTCIRNGEAWPPSAPQFRAMCRPLTPARENAAAYREYQVPLPRLKSDEEIAAGRAHIAAMRQKAASVELQPRRRRA